MPMNVVEMMERVMNAPTNAPSNDEDDDRIPAVFPKDLADAIKDKELDSETKKLDPGTEKLLKQEKRYIDKWRLTRNKDKDAEKTSAGDGTADKEILDDLTGLALSGGGIRSATFSLGIMQALARNGLLEKFDYLSTVSGGGYIGSAITWLASDKANSKSKQSSLHFGVHANDFPFGTDDPAPDAGQNARDEQKRMLHFLRGHGNYLSPGEGINIISLIGVVLRGTLLNLIVWLPVFAVVFMLGFEASAAFLKKGHIIWHGLESLSLQSLYEKIPELEPWRVEEYASFELMFQLGIGIVGLLILGVVGYSLLTHFTRGHEALKKMWYEWRRGMEKSSAVALIVAALAFVVASLPLTAKYLQYLGIIAIIAGIAMHLPSFLASVTSGKKLPIGIIVPIGAGLFLYGVFVSAFQVADSVYGNTVATYALVLTPLITGYFVNLNYIAIHRFYRDRLMETFMPDIDKALENDTGAAVAADCFYIKDISKVNQPKSPYHIVNTNVVLVNSDEAVYKSRGGDNFILSPLYCGSNATGWQRTEHYMDGNMTLATAVAISGAAANPNSGVGGQGLTRNRVLSLVMSLLNLRLGYWAHHPNNAPMGVNDLPNHFTPGAYSFLNAIALSGFTEHRAYLQLSDGGHFENMGVYELVRRRLKLILVCDGGADPDFSFSDFQTTIRRIEDDFGARVNVDDNASPDQVLPTEPEVPAYPPGAKFAKQGYMTATISYADGTEGKLIYLKTTLIKDKKKINELSFKVKGYKAEHKSFPDESTADQFFDEVQFEAYRELGFRIASQMIHDLNLRNKWDDFIKQ